MSQCYYQRYNGMRPFLICMPLNIMHWLGHSCWYFQLVEDYFLSTFYLISIKFYSTRLGTLKHAIIYVYNQNKGQTHTWWTGEGLQNVRSWWRMKLLLMPYSNKWHVSMMIISWKMIPKISINPYQENTVW